MKRAVLFVIVSIFSFFAFAYSVIFNSDMLWLTAGFFFGTSLVIVFWAGVLWSRHQLFLNESRQSLQQRIDAADTQKGCPSQQQVDILEKKWHETKRPLAFIHFRRALRLRAEV